MSRRIIKDEEIDLKELLLVFWSHRKMIAVWTASFALVSYFTAKVFLPLTYESEATIMAGMDGGGSLASPLGAANPLASLITGVGADSDLIRFEKIIGSERVVLNIVDELDLVNRNRQNKLNDRTSIDYRRAAKSIAKQIRKNTHIDVNIPVLEVSYQDEDPQLAYEVMKGYLNQLQTYINANMQTTSKATEVFIAARLNEMRARLKEAEEKLLQLQKTKGVVELGSQASAALQTASNLRARLMEKDMEIRMYKDIMTDSGQVERLKEEKNQIRAQLNELVDGSSTLKELNKRLSKNSDSQMEIFTPLKDIPTLEMEFATAQRDYWTRSTIVELLQRQYEMSRIETKKKSPVFETLDQPRLPLGPSGPPFVLIAALGMTLGLLLSMIRALLYDQLSSLKMPGIKRYVVEFVNKKRKAA